MNAPTDDTTPLEPKRNRWSLSMWLTAIAVFVFVAVVAVTQFHLFDIAMRERAERVRCCTNIKMLFLGMAMYADDYNGRTPADAADPTLLGCMLLVIKYVPQATALHCPSDTRPGDFAERHTNKLAMANISYSYVPNLKWRNTPDSAILMDRIYSTSKGSKWPSDGNHGKKGGNIGFNDGHVEWQTGLPSALKDQDGYKVVLSP